MTEQKHSAPRLWFAACFLFLIFFAFSRFSDLDARPLHHDEGVNSLFMKSLVVSNDWHYDPQNYHGPSLYYLQLIPTAINTEMRDGWLAPLRTIDGLTPTSLRCGVAFAGMCILAVILTTAPAIGFLGAFVAFLLAGFSADLLFFSRYFIHETWVVLFTLGIVVSVYRYYTTRRPLFAYLTVLSATLLFTTKETSVFHLMILALAWVLAEASKWLAEGRREENPFERLAREPGRVYGELGRHGPIILIMATLVWFLLFSSMLSNPKGAIDSLRTYFFWGGEGFNSGHVKPLLYFLSDILLKYEAALVVLSVIGVAVAFATMDLIGLFLAFWTIGFLLFYSIVPYKTPWLAENFVVPMALLSGFGVQTITRFVLDRLGGVRAALTLVFFYSSVIAVSVAQIHQTFLLTYREFDNERHPQIYAHTTREIYDLIARVDAAAVRSGLGRKMTINVFSDQYWPLPFYFLKYDNVLFWGKIEGAQQMDAPIVIALPRQKEQLDILLHDQYSITSHNLRTGTPVLLYVNTRTQNGRQENVAPLDLPKTTKGPNGLRDGLKLQLYRGPRFEGEPVKTVDGDAGWNFDWNSEGQKLTQSPFSARWTGLIKIEQAGSYRFSLNSDDGSWLYIDGESVIENGGDHAPVELSRTVTMSAGYHQIELRYYDALGGSVLKFAWTKPGGKQEIVPRSAVFH